MDPPNIIEIGGMGIRQLHAIITKKESEEGQVEYVISPEDCG